MVYSLYIFRIINFNQVRVCHQQVLLDNVLDSPISVGKGIADLRLRLTHADGDLNEGV
jgi:hypothetical protein